LISFSYNSTSSGYQAVVTLSDSGSTKTYQNTHSSQFSWSSGAKWFIGNDADASSSCFATISDIRVENQPRDTSHIQFLYDLYLKSHINWKLNEQSGLNKFSNSGNSGQYYLVSNTDLPTYYNVGHTVTKINDQNYLVVGGSRSEAYSYNSIDGIFTKVAELSVARHWHASTALKGLYDGYALVIGGETHGSFGTVRLSQRPPPARFIALILVIFILPEI